MLAAVSIRMLFLVATGVGVVLMIALLRGALRGTIRLSAVLVPVLLSGGAIFFLLAEADRGRVSGQQTGVRHSMVQENRPTIELAPSDLSLTVSNDKGLVEIESVVASAHESPHRKQRLLPSILSLLALLYVGYVVLSASTRKGTSHTGSASSA